MTNVVERSVDFLEAGRPAPADQETITKLARRTHGSIAAAGLAVSVLITLVCHLPTNIRIWTGDFTADEATAQLDRWLVLHAVRTLAGLAAVIASYRAISAARNDRSDPAAPISAV